MANRFQYGVTWYPEHWERPRAKRDVERIARAGFNVVRLGEGAWWYWEPREGEFQFELFDEAIDLCGQHGLKVILGTPTYCAPAWVPQKYPEVLRWNFNRVPMKHGSRRNLNYTSPEYFKLSDRICSALAEHYQSNANVIGWQVDNEFNCHMDVSYAPSDTVAFREWLRAKHKTLDALNDAWGTRFWSQVYDDWEQIDLPHPTATMHLNPSQLLDESRFISDCVVRFARRQANVLRKANSKWWITHNALFANVDGPKLAKELDFFSHDQYPLFSSGWASAATKLQEARSFSFPYTILEQQAGPGGQTGYLHRTPVPGEIGLWAMQTVAHGADRVLYFTWRTCPFGAEQHWHGLTDADGRDTPRLREATKLGKELAKLDDDFFDAPPARQVGVLWDFDNGVNEARIDTYTAAGRWEERRWMEELSRAHVPADVVWGTSSWDGYSVLVAPHLKLIDEKTVAKLKRFVTAGGTLVLGAQSGLKDRNNHMQQRTPPGLLTELAGVEVESWTTLAEKETRTAVFGDSRTIELIAFAEALKPKQESVRVLATWQNDALLGTSAAITEHAVKRGRVIYIGGYLPGAPIGTMIRSAIPVSPAVQASDQVESVLRRGRKGNYLVLLNHARSAQSVEGLPRGCRALIGAEPGGDGTLVLPPLGYAICRFS